MILLVSKSNKMVVLDIKIQTLRNPTLNIVVEQDCPCLQQLVQ